MTDFLLVFAALAAALAFGPAIVREFSRRKLERAAQSNDDAQCWICGASAPERVADGVYRCRACGQVQGEGAAAWRDVERRRKLEATPKTERVATAGALLDEAKLELLAAEGELPAIQQLATRSADPDNEDRTQLDEARSRLAHVLLRVGQVERLLDDAALCLRSQERAARLHGVLDSLLGVEPLGIVYAAGRHLGDLSGLRVRLNAELSRQRGG